MPASQCSPRTDKRDCKVCDLSSKLEVSTSFNGVVLPKVLVRGRGEYIEYLNVMTLCGETC